MMINFYDYAVADDKTMWLRDQIVFDKDEFLGLIGRVIYETKDESDSVEEHHAIALQLLEGRVEIYAKSMLLDAIMHANSKEYVKYARADAIERWLKDIDWKVMAESMLPWQYFQKVMEAYNAG
jgi:hypothetical protein